MKRLSCLFFTCFALSTGLLPESVAQPSADDSGSLPAYAPADPQAPVVTGNNLLASDRWWPYHVALIRPWKPDGAVRPIAPGVAGVLIFVREDGRARIDFGRDGLHEVPVGETDLVDRANRVRTGELAKTAPNFVLAIAPRLVDSAPDRPRTLGLQAAYDASGFLGVFADPESRDFEALVAELAPLRTRPGLLTAFFPEGDLPDPAVWERVRALDWPVAFLAGHVSEAYRRTLLPSDLPLPAVALYTPDGRVLFQSAFGPGVSDELSRAWASSHPEASESR